MSDPPFSEIFEIKKVVKGGKKISEMSVYQTKTKYINLKEFISQRKPVYPYNIFFANIFFLPKMYLGKFPKNTQSSPTLRILRCHYVTIKRGKTITSSHTAPYRFRCCS